MSDPKPLDQIQRELWELTLELRAHCQLADHSLETRRRIKEALAILKPAEAALFALRSDLKHGRAA